MSMKPLYLYKKLSPEKAKYLSVTEIATRNTPIIIVQIKECKLKPLQNLILILLPYTFTLYICKFNIYYYICRYKY